MPTTLQQVLNDRADQALDRVEQIASGVTDLRSANTTTQVELEQALDDADRYLALADRLGGVRVRSEPRTYGPGSKHSFITDLANQLHDQQADARVRRHVSEMSLEHRDVNTGTFNGMIPPAYVAEVFAAAAGAGRVFADLIGTSPLPPLGMSVMSGRVTSGAEADAVAENATNSTDLTLEELPTPVRGYDASVIASAQLVDRGGPAVDRALAQELGLAIARKLDADMLNADGTNDRVLGVASVSGINTITCSSATAAVFVSALGNAAAQAAAGRGLPPDIIVMHSRRWFWLTSQTSLPATVRTERPDDAPDSVIGTVHGLWVALDDNVGIEHGTSTNEDRAIVTRLDNFDLMENAVQVRVPQTSVMSRTFTALVDVAFVPDRYPAGISLVTGTGLVTPAF